MNQLSAAELAMASQQYLGYEPQEDGDTGSFGVPEISAADFANDVELANSLGFCNGFDADEFFMYCYKVLPCTKTYRHNWQACPFAHVMERSRRRDPRTCLYSDGFCDYAKKKKYCPRGDGCEFAHNLMEMWLHPSRYRTIMCKEKMSCKRELCFFAHSEAQLRKPPRASTAPLDLSTPAAFALSNLPGAQLYKSQRSELDVSDKLASVSASRIVPPVEKSVNDGNSDTQQQLAVMLQQLLGATAPEPPATSTDENPTADLLMALLKASASGRLGSHDPAQLASLLAGLLLPSGAAPASPTPSTQSPPPAPQTSHTASATPLDGYILEQLAALGLDQRSAAVPQSQPPSRPQTYLMPRGQGFPPSTLLNAGPRPQLQNSAQLRNAAQLQAAIRAQAAHAQAQATAQAQSSVQAQAMAQARAQAREAAQSTARAMPATTMPLIMRSTSGSPGVAIGYPVQSEGETAGSPRYMSRVLSLQDMENNSVAHFLSQQQPYGG